MMEEDNTPLFTVSNHHMPAAGTAPIVDGDEPNTYHGYFENAAGEQSIFIYRRDTGQAELWSGDAGWHRPFPVLNGQVEGLVLSTEERNWLQLCWQTTNVRRSKHD